MNTFFKDSFLTKLKQGLFIFLIAKATGLLLNATSLLSSFSTTTKDDNYSNLLNHTIITFGVHILTDIIICYFIYNAYQKTQNLLTLKIEENVDNLLRSLATLLLILGVTSLSIMIFFQFIFNLLLTYTYTH